MATSVKFVGKSGSASIEIAEGHSIREVLVDAARELSLPNPEQVVETLAPVVDSRNAELDDPAPVGAKKITAGPSATNG